MSIWVQNDGAISWGKTLVTQYTWGESVQFLLGTSAWNGELEEVTLTLSPGLAAGFASSG